MKPSRLITFVAACGIVACGSAETENLSPVQDVEASAGLGEAEPKTVAELDDCFQIDGAFEGYRDDHGPLISNVFEFAERWVEVNDDFEVSEQPWVEGALVPLSVGAGARVTAIGEPDVSIPTADLLRPGPVVVDRFRAERLAGLRLAEGESLLLAVTWFENFSAWKLTAGFGILAGGDAVVVGNCEEAATTQLIALHDRVVSEGFAGSQHDFLLESSHGDVSLLEFGEPSLDDDPLAAVGVPGVVGNADHPLTATIVPVGGEVRASVCFRQGLDQADGFCINSAASDGGPVSVDVLVDSELPLEIFVRGPEGSRAEVVAGSRTVSLSDARVTQIVVELLAGDALGEIQLS